jgi:hypothetical protein
MRGESFSPLVNLPLQKNHQSEKIGKINRNQKNPKSRMAHLRMLCFFSLTGGLIKFF